MFNYEFGNLTKNKKVAIAVSGGSDSMALLNFMLSIAEKFAFTVVALNVEHGIRGEESVNDSKFVEDYCTDHDIELLSYKIDCLTFAKNSKLSIEESARVLRYDCFFDAIKSGRCDIVATAHHSSDNAESILFNLLRGSGLKGLTGIKANFNDQIIRPFLKVSKAEIEEYIAKNNIPFVTDSTNLNDDYTRNHLRLNVMPEIKKAFPTAEKSLTRIAEIATEEDEFLDRLSLEYARFEDDAVYIETCAFPVLFRRATILAFKHLGIAKDWEKVHVDDVLSLTSKENGTTINLPKGVLAVKEYDNVVIYRNDTSENIEIPFVCSKINFGELSFNIEKVAKRDVTDEMIRKGFYADLDKIPKTAVIRTVRSGDTFTKFGGGTKSLADYFTDIKLPLRLRDKTLIIADRNKVLAILGVAISNDVKIDEKTTSIVKLG